MDGERSGPILQLLVFENQRRSGFPIILQDLRYQHHPPHPRHPANHRLFHAQKLDHGVVAIVSSTAAQSDLLGAPMYAASKHAINGFTRSLADIKPKLSIRVNADAPGCVKTPLWIVDKLTRFDDAVDTWVTAEQVAQVMLDLIRDPKNMGPQGRGHTLKKMARATMDVYGLIEEQFGK
ncbi:uncharacterized protein PAC_15269 [Phialocephala subalpina]|uniref:Uncharacterized protein n=1 Tax=Phialocephala subalpina TaxID=576137 RepID=A0A1L7XK01_9HELO|nr:uncharacterized protein PAC_15269 [Phialocephala subalpina]